MSKTALSDQDIEQLEEIARRCRIDIVKMTNKAGSGHPGGSLSAIDILTALFMKKMNHDPADPLKKERDRFVMSKGHASPGYYSILAKAGYIPEEELMHFRKFKSSLQGHPEKSYLPFIDISTGGLGQGLSVANGIAHGLKIQKIEKARVYVLMGDGETQEGQVWEAAMAAAHYKLDNLCAILDRNMLQIDGNTEDIMALEPLDQKWKAFNWNVLVIDGHDFRAIINALDTAEATKGRPTIIIARTIKGKGVSFMENNVRFHGVAPNNDELAQALKELGAERER